MQFYSTNGKSKLVDFKTALLKGLADDGGLYMPTAVAKFSILNFEFSKLLKKFINIPEKELKKICDDAFNFPVPLVKLDDDLYILELFHGPTSSFKDFGARFMARVMNYYLKKSGKKLNIVVATSGDTGSAVAAGFYGLPNIKVFVLYPSKRISKIQEQQIATWGKNIIALEVKGDFDDCQHLAKQALADKNLRSKINLSSANSINIGRLLPQMFYYFKGVNDLRQHAIFVVPSGNFGNLTAGLFAKKMGASIKKFIAAVNVNSQVPDFLKTRRLPANKTTMTMSSAMDVGSPSNWARIMDLYKNNMTRVKNDLAAVTITEKTTKDAIRQIYKKYGYILDPHTAVGVAASLKSKEKGAKVVLATAHPAKFKEIVKKIIEAPVTIPDNLQRFLNKKKASVLIRNDFDSLALTLRKLGV